MNKRIKQLAKQSGFSTELSEAMTTRHNTASGLEKFAELIVRECAEICLEANDHKNILRHFGVEE